ncbi:hypothetical protein V6N11_083976 [Hibiscus sabdariffa]|uniref:Uncharacterized protein n=1 Tax=Hibiscus sabdariffa TaxID=183260 RepID=A0ABR2QDB0_9ROSI
MEPQLLHARLAEDIASSNDFRKTDRGIDSQSRARHGKPGSTLMRVKLVDDVMASLTRGEPIGESVLVEPLRSILPLFQQEQIVIGVHVE